LGISGNKARVVDAVVSYQGREEGDVRSEGSAINRLEISRLPIRKAGGTKGGALLASINLQYVTPVVLVYLRSINHITSHHSLTRLPTALFTVRSTPESQLNPIFGKPHFQRPEYPASLGYPTEASTIIIVGYGMRAVVLLS
jgi:hypothetical protein